MKPQFILVLLALLLAACGNTPAQPSAADIEKTAAAIVQTRVARTQTALPSISTSSTTVVTPPPATLTLTPEVTLPAPTLTPPPPTLPPMITPDAYQVEHWKEYQVELAKRVLADGGGVVSTHEAALCEWDILGYSAQEVYVWAQCASPNAGGAGPAVIRLNIDNSVFDVIYAFPGADRDSRIRSLFPVGVQEKIGLYFSYWSSDSGIVHELRLHLQYRRMRPDLPPLVILLTMPTETPVP